MCWCGVGAVIRIKSIDLHVNLLELYLCNTNNYYIFSGGETWTFGGNIAWSPPTPQPLR